MSLWYLVHIDDSSQGKGSCRGRTVSGRVRTGSGRWFPLLLLFVPLRCKLIEILVLLLGSSLIPPRCELAE